MEIGALASSALYQMNQGSVKVNGYSQPTDVGVAMLSKQLALSEASGEKRRWGSHYCSSMASLREKFNLPLSSISMSLTLNLSPT